MKILYLMMNIPEDKEWNVFFERLRESLKITLNNLEKVELFKFYFEDTDPDSDIDDSKWVEAKTMEDALKTLEEFKKNPTGGSYSYEMHWGYNKEGQKLGYDVSVDFLSFDTKNIEVVMFSVREGIFEMAHEKELKKVFEEINKHAKVIAATQKTDYYTEDYHWLAVIEEILSGNIYTKYEYKFTE
jgi:hypothetical protein